MDADGQPADGTVSIIQIARSIVPWLVLAVVVWVLWGIWGGFTTAQRSASLAAQGSAEASSSAVASGSVATSGTGLVAKVRSDVPLRSQPDSGAEIVATARVGATLTILTRQDAWMRVKDKAGHIGWIPNDTRYIAVQAK